MSELGFVVLGSVFFIGLFCGQFMASNNWRSNADRIQRFNYGGQFYKVFRIGDPESQADAKIHMDDYD